MKFELQGGNGVICKNNNGITSVSHFTLNNFLPELIDSTMPDLGLSNARLIIDEGYMICQFTRDNSVEFPNYYDTTKNEAYLLVAFGSLTLGNRQDVNNSINFFQIE